MALHRGQQTSWPSRGWLGPGAFQCLPAAGKRSLDDTEKDKKKSQLNYDLPLILISKRLKSGERGERYALESVEYGNTKSPIVHSVCSVSLSMASKQALYAQNHPRL